MRHLTVLPFGAGTARCYKSSETVQHLTQTQYAHQHHAHYKHNAELKQTDPGTKDAERGAVFSHIMPKMDLY